MIAMHRDDLPGAITLPGFVWEPMQTVITIDGTDGPEVPSRQVAEAWQERQEQDQK